MQLAMSHSLSMASLRLCLINFISIVVMVHGRMLRHNNASGLLISDGVHHFESQYSNIIRLNELPSLSSDVCSDQIYGFFPCAYNTGGYIFQIVVYQYLLFIGDKLVMEGSDRLFRILGTGIYGASVFRILKVLPGLITVIVSGVITSKEKAQEQVSQGVSVYAGSTILNLTLLWLMCVIFGRKEMTQISIEESSASTCMLSKAKFYGFMESGTTTDKWTRYTAGIMLLTLIPFVIVELVNIFSTHTARRMVILITLIVSTTSLFAYFAYQILHPWMQERSLQYTKYKYLVAGFLHHVQRHAKGKLITEDGHPNIGVIKRLFDQIDEDDDQCLKLKDLENLILDIEFGKQMDKKYATSEIWKTFDVNSDGKIHEQEFIEGIKKCIDEAKKLAEKDDPTSKDILNEVMNKKMKERATIEHLMSRILKHVHSQALETEQLINGDGSPNVDHIKRLFRQYDRDDNKVISQSELEQLIHTVRFGEMHLDHDEIVKKVITEFDLDGDRTIDEEEFVHGMTKWLNKAIAIAKRKDAKCIDEFDKIMWGEVDKLLYNGGINYKLLTWALNKSVFEVLLGIVMLTFLARPLTTSIKQFSNAMGLPSSIISFVIVPVAINARRAALAIFPASQKSKKTASLTFSEIYSGVIMNNLVGLTTLLAIVYSKDLKWDYSAEVLIIFVVCAIVGVFAFLRTTYPIWTCIIAFLLYPFSLVLVYVLRYLLGWN